MLPKIMKFILKSQTSKCIQISRKLYENGQAESKRQGNKQAGEEGKRDGENIYANRLKSPPQLQATSLGQPNNRSDQQRRSILVSTVSVSSIIYEHDAQWTDTQMDTLLLHTVRSHLSVRPLNVSIVSKSHCRLFLIFCVCLLTYFQNYATWHELLVMCINTDMID